MRDKTTENQMEFYNIFIQTSSKMNLCIFLRILHEKIQKVENNGVGVQYGVTPHLFRYKDQKSSYLQLCRRLNGKMLVLGFCSLTNTKQSFQYTIKRHLSGPPMPKFEANMNYIHPSPPSSMKQCNKSATVKFNTELFLI